MKQTRFLTAAALATVLFACNNKNATGGLPIPKDAGLVVHINSASLTSKLSWDDIKSADWFQKELTEQKDSFKRKIMENPENSGVDTKGDFAMFLRKRSRSGYMVFEGKVKDAAKFEALVKKNEEAKIQKDGDYNWTKVDDNDVLSWNKDQFIVISETRMNSGYGEDIFTLDSLRMFTKEIVGISGDESLSDDNRFADLMKEQGDLHIWMNQEHFSPANNTPIPIPGLEKLMKGNIGAMTLNFENGRIALKSKQYYSEEMTKVMAKMPNKAVSADVLNRIPMENAIGVMATNFDPATMREFLKMMGIDGVANSYLGKAGLTLDDVVTATNGQFVIAMSDFQVKRQEPVIGPDGMPISYGGSKPEMKMLFATNVNNQASFDKLFSLAKPSIDEASTEWPMTYKTQNGWFALSNNPEATDKFLAGGKNNSVFASKIGGHPFGMYLDLQKMIQAGTTANPFMMGGDMTPMTQIWKDFIITGGEFKDGVASMEMVVNLTDNSVNSLKLIYQSGVKAAEASKKRAEAMRESIPPQEDVKDAEAVPVQ